MIIFRESIDEDFNKIIDDIDSITDEMYFNYELRFSTKQVWYNQNYMQGQAEREHEWKMKSVKTNEEELVKNKKEMNRIFKKFKRRIFHVFFETFLHSDMTERNTLMELGVELIKVISGKPISKKLPPILMRVYDSLKNCQEAMSASKKIVRHLKKYSASTIENDNFKVTNAFKTMLMSSSKFKMISQDFHNIIDLAEIMFKAIDGKSDAVVKSAYQLKSLMETLVRAATIHVEKVFPRKLH